MVLMSEINNGLKEIEGQLDVIENDCEKIDHAY